MTRAHATADELQALRRRELDPASIVELTRHLASCEACAALARGGVDPSAAGGLLAGAARVTHPDFDEEIVPYVDGQLDAAGRRDVAEHLLGCARCREDVADLQRERGRRLRPRRLAAWGAAAAAVAAAVIAALLMMQRAPSPRAESPGPIRVAPPPARPAEWEAIVADALRAGRIDRPAALESVRSEPESVRGSARPQHAALAPAGVVIAATRPQFRWPSKGEPAVVSVFDGRSPVATSGVITASAWTPEQPLARGRVYTWQVELIAGRERRVMPEPPDPPARFRVLDEATAREIEAARGTRPDDHLLLGILEARAGLKREALDDLARADNSRAAPLAASIRSW